jgi:hypothetical protein
MPTCIRGLKKTIEAEIMFDRKSDLTAENEHVAEYHQK